MSMELEQDLAGMQKAIEEDRELSVPNTECLKGIYEAIVLMQKRHNARIKEIEKSASERNEFYGDIQKIRAEHHLAEIIQRGMLPQVSDSLRKDYGIDIYADMDTAWEVGGDYYDFFPIDKTHFFIAIGDVSGKSISAAMLSMVVKNIMEIYLVEGGKLEDICQKISKQLYLTQRTDGHMFVTGWFGILDTETGEMDYVNAGHEPPVLIRKSGEYLFLKEKSGLPIASYYNPKKPEKNVYHGHTLVLEKGDAILLYTDGVTDTENMEGTHFGDEGIMNALKAVKAEATCMEEVIKYMQRRIIDHADHEKRDDDITLLGIRFLGVEGV